MAPITMEIPAEWLAEAGLQNFEPPRPAIQCSAEHELIALNEIEPFVRLVPLDANGFRRSKMMPVLEMIRSDLPCKEPIYVARQSGRQWPYFLRDGVHRFYASRALGFTHVPADVIPASY
jgi:hypothetical protein